MLKRLTLIALVAMFASITSVSAAHTPPKHRPIPPKGPTITTSPQAPRIAHIHATYIFSGTLFPAKAAVPVKLLCPAWGSTQYGQWSWTSHTNASGTFREKRTVPSLKKVQHAACHIYAEAITPRGAFWVSIEFDITR